MSRAGDRVMVSHLHIQAFTYCACTVVSTEGLHFSASQFFIKVSSVPGGGKGVIAPPPPPLFPEKGNTKCNSIKFPTII